MLDTEEVHFTSRATGSDLAWSVAAISRASGWAVGLGTIMVVTGLVSVWLGSPGWVNLPLAVLGVLFLTGLFGVPFSWWTVRRRGDVLLEPFDVRADAEGISFDSPVSSSTSSWSVYRQAKETPRAFLLDTGTGVIQIIAKRSVAEAELESFRALLVGAGLLETRPKWRRRLKPLVWVTVGLAISASLMLGPLGLRALQANARIDLTVDAAEGEVTVMGSTDLPDGTLIAVDVYHADQWRRQAQGGRSPDVETFPWIDGGDFSVSDGAFHATFEIRGWPPGRGGAVAYFWVDGAQPVALQERFGVDGSELRGPDVRVLDDGTRRLEVRTLFDIPSPSPGSPSAE